MTGMRVCIFRQVKPQKKHVLSASYQEVRDATVLILVMLTLIMR